MTRTDKALIFCTLAAIALMSATIPFRPLLIAEHPIAHSAVTGGLPTIAAGAALARVGESSLAIVVVAGIFGMVKFDLNFWLAGRTWTPKLCNSSHLAAARNGSPSAWRTSRAGSLDYL